MYLSYLNWYLLYIHLACNFYLCLHLISYLFYLHLARRLARCGNGRQCSHRFAPLHLQEEELKWQWWLICVQWRLSGLVIIHCISTHTYYFGTIFRSCGFCAKWERKHPRKKKSLLGIAQNQGGPSGPFPNVLANLGNARK